MSFDYFTKLRELKSRPCMDCGQTFDPVCMDFDHRPDEVKLGSIVKFRYDEAGFLAEIAKCDLICACCHRLRTKNRGYSETGRIKLRKPKPPGFGDKISKLKRGVPISGEARKNMGRPKKSVDVIRECSYCDAKLRYFEFDRRVKQKRVYCDVEHMRLHRGTSGWRDS